MDEQINAEEEENILSLDLTLSKATCLYIATKQAVIISNSELMELRRKLASEISSGAEKEHIDHLRESLNILIYVNKTNTELLEEIGQIVKELEPVESRNEKSKIIHPKDLKK